MEDKIITEEELENALHELHVLSNNIVGSCKTTQNPATK